MSEPLPFRYAFKIMSPRRRVRFGWAYALRRALFAVAKLGLQIGLIMALIGALAYFMSYAYQAGWDGMGARLAAIWPEGRS
jgi:hypothetical protein